MGILPPRGGSAACGREGGAARSDQGRADLRLLAHARGRPRGGLGTFPQAGFFGPRGSDSRASLSDRKAGQFFLGQGERTRVSYPLRRKGMICSATEDTPDAVARLGGVPQPRLVRRAG